MPTRPISEERREELRRLEWEDREFYTSREAQDHARKMEILRQRQDHAQKIAEIRFVQQTKAKTENARVNQKLRRTVVLCIAFLTVFRREVPVKLFELLDA